jgi:hypothetical protein
MFHADLYPLDAEAGMLMPALWLSSALMSQPNPQTNMAWLPT